MRTKTVWMAGCWLACAAMVLAQTDLAKPAPRAVDTLVLCPKAFQPALEAWIGLRQSQGHRLLVQAPAASAYQIQQQIRRAANEHPLKTLVLIGDAVADRGQGAANTLPTDYRLAKVNSLYGSEPEIATDSTFADLDGDGRPDLHVGRIPADSAQELAAYLHKVIDYEQSQDLGPWRRRIELVAGVGNFDPLVDSVIEQTARRLVTDLVPAWYEVNVTVANWRSPYCPDPRHIGSVIVDRVSEGCLYWVYLGHGTLDALAPLDAGRLQFPVFGQQHALRLHCQNGSPIALFFSCYTGAFDARRDCLAETLLRNPQGPVACVCGTRMTMPYGLATFSHEILQATGGEPQPNLGTLLTDAKVRLCQTPAADSENAEDYRAMIETLGQTFSPTAGLLAQERLEHAQMIHLLGDPLLRIAQPGAMELRLDVAEQQPGAPVQVRGIAAEAGTLTLELCYNRDRLRIRPPRRKQLDFSDASSRDFEQTYAGSNNRVCCRQAIQVEAGEFTAEIAVPADAGGACHVRGYLQGTRQAWAQAIPIMLK